MIDHSKVRSAFRSRIVGEGKLFAQADVAFEGRAFNPKGKTLWLRETLIPVNGRMESENQERMLAMMQYDVFVPHGSGTETLEAKVKAIADLFEPSTDFPSYDGVSCVVDSVDPVQLSDDDKVWLGKGLRITFRAYNG